MKLNNLKASLLAVVFALGLNTTAQSMQQHAQIESIGIGAVSGPRVVIGGMGGVYQPHTAHTGVSCDDESLFEVRSSGCESGRRGHDRGGVVIEETITDRIKVIAPKKKDDHCRETSCGLSIQETIAGYVKNFHSTQEWVRIEAQKSLFSYLKSREEQKVLAAGKAIADIIIESNKPQPKPAPQPKPNTVHQVLKSNYELSLDTCLLRAMITKMFGEHKNPYTIALDTLNKAGLKFSLTAAGDFNVTLDPCNPACANLCGPEKADCGCKGDGHESGYTHEDKDDCKCHSKGKPHGPTKADGRAIDLLIETVGNFSHCEPAKLILMSVFDISTYLQQATITNLFSQHCAKKADV